jgi:hypothetical protein
VLDINILNISLLTKWLVRFKDPSIQGLWMQILICKYLALTPTTSR